MANLPDKSIIDGSGNPTTLQFKTAMGALWDWASDLLGTDSSDKAAARTALGAVAKSGDTMTGDLEFEDGTKVVMASGSYAASVSPETLTANRDHALPDLDGTLAIHSEIRQLSASVDSGALTVTLQPCQIEFRSATLNDGSTNRRTVPSAISLTVPSGATLGSANGRLSRQYVLAIDNAGTVELAIIGENGGHELSESHLITTTAISAAADGNSVAYSTTGRTSVPYRIVGYIESTQATAGAWAAAPSRVQGAGGVAIGRFQTLGIGQTWQVVTGSRALGTTYYNTTGKPILVTVEGTNSSASWSLFTPHVNGVALSPARAIVNASTAHLSFIVPPGASYMVYADGGTYSLSTWTELR